MQVGQDAAVAQPHLIRGRPSLALAHRNTDACEPGAAICERRLVGDPPVLVVPLRPFLPLGATHPAVHERNAHLVGHLDETVEAIFGFQAQHVQPEILGVRQDRRIAVRVVAVQQVGCVGGAADRKSRPLTVR